MLYNITVEEPASRTISPTWEASEAAAPPEADDAATPPEADEEEAPSEADEDATDTSEVEAGSEAVVAALTPTPKYVGARDRDVPADVSAVAEALGRGGFRVSVINMEDDVDRILSAIVVEKPALVFNMVREVYGDTTQNAQVAALLDLLGIPYTGSDPLTLTTTQNRARAHLVLTDAGVPLPRFGVVRDVNAIPDTAEFAYPLIVTQTYDDIYKDEGIESPIEDRNELVTRVIELNKEFDLPLLVEEYIAHRRVHATVLGNRVLEILPLTEAQLWEAREDDEEAAGCARGGVRIAQLSQELADRIRQLARRAFRALECRDLAQIDFHLDDEENPYVVDVRPIPDFDLGRPFQVAAECSEQGFDERVAQVAQITAKRAGVRMPPPPGKEAAAQASEPPPAPAAGTDAAPNES